MKKARMGIKRVQKGFTLIELMIVVAIIGILAAIAIPQYQDYVTRSRWTDNLASITPMKQAIAECAQQNALAPAAGAAAINVPALCADLAALGAANTGVGFTANPTPANGQVVYAAGVITITGINQLAANGCTVTVTPQLSASSITWNQATTVCGRAQTGV
ncbi:pilin [Cupriavidus metallidurans]|uniref:pilin n=1 Tax=Cupriavidus metallidurans TaxID=119219 RepID=UPI00055BC909|nr:prepilin-type N-terminal cleavage/methylation domain-containing protein [Cupriavidus metallidurans]